MVWMLLAHRLCHMVVVKESPAQVAIHGRIQQSGLYLGKERLPVQAIEGRRSVPGRQLIATRRRSSRFFAVIPPACWPLESCRDSALWARELIALAMRRALMLQLFESLCETHKHDVADADAQSARRFGRPYNALTYR